MIRHAVATFGGDDDTAASLGRTAGSDDLRCTGHALDGLVQVDIQGIAAIGGQYDVVGFLHRSHGHPLGEGDTLGVRFPQIPGIDAGNLVFAIDGDVEQEIRRCQRRDLAYLLPYRVPLGIAPRC